LVQPNFLVFQFYNTCLFFLIGIYFAKYKIRFDLKILFGAFTATSIFLFYYLYTGKIPTRFPPSFYWILSPMFFIYIYYVLSNILIKKRFPTEIIQRFGRNVLFYLVMSNILLFILKMKYSNVVLNSFESLGLTFLILSIITYLTFIISKS